jgi:hypothetical protein
VPIREPTPRDALLAWWRRALVDPTAPRHDADPQPGFYRTQLVKRGPWVAVRIDVLQDLDPDTGERAAPERLAGLVGGEPTSPARLERLWLFCEPITEAAYERILRAPTEQPDLLAVLRPLPADALMLGPAPRR